MNNKEQDKDATLQNLKQHLAKLEAIQKRLNAKEAKAAYLKDRSLQYEYGEIVQRVLSDPNNIDREWLNKIINKEIQLNIKKAKE